MLRKQSATRIVAPCASAIVTRNDGGNALGRGLSPKRVVKIVTDRPQVLFANSEARAHHRREVVVNNERRGNVDTIGEVALRNHDIRGGAWRERRRPCEIECCFYIITRYESGIVPIDKVIDTWGRNSKDVHEVVEINAENVAARHDGNRLTRAVNTRLIEGIEVVDRREVGGRNGVFPVRECDLSPDLVVIRLPRDFDVCVLRSAAQTHHSANHRAQRDGNLNLRCIGNECPALQVVLVHLGVKGRFDLLHGSAEGNKAPAGGNSLYVESLRQQPLPNRGGVLLRDAKSCANVRRLQPMVILRGRWRVHFFDESLEGRILLVARRKHEQHLAEFAIARQTSGIHTLEY